MADILKLAFEKQISASGVVEWLRSKEPGVAGALKDYDRVKHEFVPFFLNYLRDQTSCLLEGCRSTNQSPAKTPASFRKHKNSNAPLKTFHSTPVSGNSGSAASRSLMFSRGQIEGLPPVPRSRGTSTTDSSVFSDSSCGFKTPDTSRDKSSSFNRSTGGKSSVDSGHRRHRKTPDRSGSARQSWTNMFPSPSSFTIGDFLVSPTPGSGSKKSSRKKEQRERFNASAQSKSSSFSLDSREEFPSLASPVSADLPNNAQLITPSRRIAPTRVNEGSSGFSTKRIVPQKESSPVTNVAFSVKEEPSPTSSNDSKDISFDTKSSRLIPQTERQQLVREAKSLEVVTPKGKGRILTEMDTTPSKLENLKNALHQLPSLTEHVKPSRQSVTNEEFVNVLVDIYAGCLHVNLVPNLMIEFYFVLQLLTVQAGDFDSLTDDVFSELDEINHLGNVHNAVYFAVKVLATQQRLLTLLDKGTMKLLIQNPRIEEFGRDFQPVLVEQLVDLQEHCPTRRLSMYPQSPIGGVAYQTENDGNKNFPNNQSFQRNKKQRDEFYALHREWQENRLTGGWSLSESLGHRIKNLVASKTEMANYIHFARLFHEALIQMCKGDASFKEEGDDEQVSELSRLRQTDPKKYKMLQERFVMPSKAAGSPVPAPSFPGDQEFFRDFIVAADSYTFNHHLTAAITARVAKLNQLQILSPEMDADVDAAELGPERQQLTTALLTLRLLGKFLGFLSFLPFRAQEKLPEVLQRDHVASRNAVNPSVNLAVCLRDARKNGTVVLTVPWVVEYLSQMDSLASKLDAHRIVFIILLQIYREVSQQFSRNKTTSFSCALILLNLGWLFEQSVFPEGLFFTESSSPEEAVRVSESSLDQIDLVDHSLLYTCCPYLGEAKSLLFAAALGTIHGGNNIRKIKPLTEEVQSDATPSEKQLQIQLEDNFYHNHPPSLKRTVDFVGDRISSNFIKRFRAHTLPKLLERCSTCVREIVANITEDPVERRTKKKAEVKFEDFALKTAQTARDDATSEAHGYTDVKCQEALPLLLPEEECGPVVSVATQICCRVAREKISSWLATHISTNMLLKEMKTEFDKLIKQSVESRSRLLQKPLAAAAPAPPGGATGNEALHDQCQFGPSDIIILLKEVMFKLYTEREKCSSEELCSILDQIHQTLTCRQDVVPAVLKLLGRMTVDLASMLACSHARLWRPDVKQRLLVLWLNELRAHVSFENVVSSKQVYEIQSGDNSEKCWESFTDYMTMLTGNGLLRRGTVAACLSAVGADLPKEIALHFAGVLCSVVQEELDAPKEASSGAESTSSRSEETDCILRTLEWLLKLCGAKNSPIHTRLTTCIVGLREKQAVLVQTEAEETNSTDYTSTLGSDSSVVGNQDSRLRTETEWMTENIDCRSIPEKHEGCTEAEVGSGVATLFISSPNNNVGETCSTQGLQKEV